MRQLAVAAVVLVLARPAHADRKETWRGVLLGSVVTTIASMGALYWGHRTEQHAFDKLDMQSSPATFDEVDREAKRGRLIATAGTFTLAIGIVATGIAAYENLTLSVAPVVTAHGGGAAVRLRF